MLSQLNSLRNREEGFTLIELLIVVIIIGILAAIALPIFTDQTKVAVDATVKSDVRNSVTNITNAQGQALTEVRAVVSRDDTKVALTALASGAGVQTTVVATTASPNFTNVPVLGTPYTVQGWNPSGKQYLGTAAAGKGAYSFDSTTGKFTQADGAAPSASGGVTGGTGSTGTTPTVFGADPAYPDNNVGKQLCMGSIDGSCVTITGITGSQVDMTGSVVNAAGATETSPTNHAYIVQLADSTGKIVAYSSAQIAYDGNGVYRAGFGAYPSGQSNLTPVCATISLNSSPYTQANGKTATEYAACKAAHSSPYSF